MLWKPRCMDSRPPLVVAHSRAVAGGCLAIALSLTLISFRARPPLSRARMLMIGLFCTRPSLHVAKEVSGKRAWPES
jgi:hypothetical protein